MTTKRRSEELVFRILMAKGCEHQHVFLNDAEDSDEYDRWYDAAHSCEDKQPEKFQVVWACPV